MAKKIEVGKNDLVTWCKENNREDLITEWGNEKNEKAMSEYSRGSEYKAFWVCSKGHSFSTKIGNRTILNNGCPYCNGSKVLKGFNDLETWCRENNKEYLISEYDTTRNTKAMSEYMPKVDYKAWWLCPKGHSYQTIIGDRTKDINATNCPVCAGKKVLEGFNDLATTHKELLVDWNYEKNTKLGITPTNISSGSSKKVWWTCHICKHTWCANLSSRTGKNYGCPKCSKEKQRVSHQQSLINSRGSLKENNPEVLKYWNYEKNMQLGITPETITSHSGKSVYWNCDLGHTYKQPIHHKVNGIGCPVCAREHSSSFPEQAILYYIKKYFEDTINGDRSIVSPYELDVYVPSKRVAIEYDGQAFHNNIEKDMLKAELCKEKGITLINVREPACPELNKDNVYVCKEGDTLELSKIIKDILNNLGVFNSDVDVERDRTTIYSAYLLKVKDNSIVKKCPHLLNEWDFEENADLNPESISCGTHKKVHWICSKGHKWVSSVANRVNGLGCPVCSHQQVLVGYSDLATTDPELLGEWDYEENSKISLTPNNVMRSTNKKAYWICSKGHKWMATINSRTNGTGCPYCSGRRAIIGVSDFATLHSDLLPEWDYTLNDSLGLNPQNISSFSKDIAHWICPKGHSYTCSVAQRSSGCNCPICASKRIQEGINDLKSFNGEILKEWDYENNAKIGIYPNQVSLMSTKKVYWLCSKNHSYMTAICDRTRTDGKATGCPYCANKKVLTGFNDFETWCKETNNEVLLSEYDLDLNEDLPCNIFSQSSKKIHWKCSKHGHSFTSVMYSRTQGKGCPVCANRQLLVGFNDLKTWCIENHREQLIEEFDTEKNELPITAYFPSTAKKVWWKCSKCSHSWLLSINERNRLKGITSCPNCRGKGI